MSRAGAAPRGWDKIEADDAFLAPDMTDTDLWIGKHEDGSFGFFVSWIVLACIATFLGCVFLAGMLIGVMVA